MSTRGKDGRTLSLRLRIVLITAVAVTIMEALTGLTVILLLREGLLSTADWHAAERAEEVADLAADGRLPPMLPSGLEGDTTVQVLQDGTVVSSTLDIAGNPPLPVPTTRSTTAHVDEFRRLPGLGPGPYTVATVHTGTPDGPADVVVAVSTEDVRDVTDAALGVGSLGLLALLLPLSGVLWLAVGRALAPVEAIRRRAETITGARLDERVPEPRREDEVGRLARTINAMLGRLDESAGQQRRFLADAAHELRSPVASLRALLETLQPGPGQPAAEEVADLLAETLRMQALVDQLLVLARADSGALVGNRRPVDLDDLVQGLVAAYRSAAVRPETRVLTAVQVSGDAAMLEQVVRNLLDNAVRHARSRVQVGLEVARGTAVLTVDDDGPGVPVVDRDRVFDRFTRLDTARLRDDGGVGLGLAIVADIVAEHGGTVRAADAPLGGARFEVRLPVAGPGGRRRRVGGTSMAATQP